MQYNDRRLNIQIVKPHLPEFSQSPTDKRLADLQQRYDELKAEQIAEVRSHLRTMEAHGQTLSECIELNEQLKSEKISHGQTLRDFYWFRCGALRANAFYLVIGVLLGCCFSAAVGLSQAQQSLVPDRPPVQSFKSSN
jgi:hypothetical protein